MVLLASWEEEWFAGTNYYFGMRYGIITNRAFGVPMARMKALAKRLGSDHDQVPTIAGLPLDEVEAVAET